jgi:serine O-acetyltransferase
MNQTIDNNSLKKYLKNQLNLFFPDGVESDNLTFVIDKAMIKIEYCFKYISLPYYSDKHGTSIFNHLNADHYTMFIYFCSYQAFSCNDNHLASKLFYLNKVLHSFHCMYDTKLPDIFLIIHGLGTVLGKAKYNNFFVITQGCTVGADNNHIPIIAEKVILYPNVSVIGKCNIGENTTVSINTLLLNSTTGRGNIVFERDGKLKFKKARKNQLKKFFKII